MRTNLIKNEIDEIKKCEEKIKRKDLKYETKKYTRDFQQYETIRSFGESIHTRKAKIVKNSNMDLLKDIVEFNNKSWPRAKECQDKKEILTKVQVQEILMKGRELTLNAFKRKIFAIKETQGEGLKILTPNQMLKRWLTALAQVKAGNTSKNLLNEIREIIYSLYRASKLLKKYITRKWIK